MINHHRLSEFKCCWFQMTISMRTWALAMLMRIACGVVLTSDLTGMAGQCISVLITRLRTVSFVSSHAISHRQRRTWNFENALFFSHCVCRFNFALASYCARQCCGAELAPKCCCGVYKYRIAGSIWKSRNSNWRCFDVCMMLLCAPNTQHIASHFIYRRNTHFWCHFCIASKCFYFVMNYRQVWKCTHFVWWWLMFVSQSNSGISDSFDVLELRSYDILWKICCILWKHCRYGC